MSIKQLGRPGQVRPWQNSNRVGEADNPGPYKLQCFARNQQFEWENFGMRPMQAKKARIATYNGNHWDRAFELVCRSRPTIAMIQEHKIVNQNDFNKAAEKARSNGFKLVGGACSEDQGRR